jgi:hypothetical protein
MRWALVERIGYLRETGLERIGRLKPVEDGERGVKAEVEARQGG